MLTMTDVDVFYGPVQALHHINLTVAEGEVVAVLGGNASGKSTTIKSVLQLAKPRRGTVELEGRSLAGLTTPEVIRMGIGSIPESRRLFAEMTVEENILMGLYGQRRGLGPRERQDRVEEATQRFPRLRERRRQWAGTLSGGEQQMVAMARALIARPKLICIDEPSMGLSPAFVDVIYELLFELKAAGTTMLIVEQSANRSLELADRGYILHSGQIVLSGAASDLRDNDEVRRAYLGGE